ncbi:MAG: SDR family NAD(P)-dependent oxidoreductase [Cellulosilyticum sp.]|nr:SDR family NAD(P)-dependent oxidoreductase [Cellulosilyticum sp.]
MKNNPKVIVVSGASTGIGYSIAKELASDGNKVYAGARKESDIKRLSEMRNIVGIELDIIKPEQIQKAVQQIEQKEGHIDVLINNAGVTGWGPVMDRDMVAIVQPGAIQSQAFIKDEKDFNEYKACDKSDFAKYAIPMLETAFHRKPVTKEKSPLLVVNAIKHAIYKKKNAIYYQPGRRLVPDLLFAKLPYKAIDMLIGKIQRKADL